MRPTKGFSFLFGLSAWSGRWCSGLEAARNDNYNLDYGTAAATTVVSQSHRCHVGTDERRPRRPPLPPRGPMHFWMTFCRAMQRAQCGVEDRRNPSLRLRRKMHEYAMVNSVYTSLFAMFMQEREANRWIWKPVCLFFLCLFCMRPNAATMTIRKNTKMKIAHPYAWTRENILVDGGFCRGRCSA
jgi:hypothetical protein